MVKKIYVAAPMTGIEDFNRPAMREVAKRLNQIGYEAVHTADEPDGLEYMEYIKRGLEKLAECDAIYLLKGYKNSNGVMKYELPYAIEHAIDVFEQGGESDFLEWQTI